MRNAVKRSKKNKKIKNKGRASEKSSSISHRGSIGYGLATLRTVPAEGPVVRLYRVAASMAGELQWIVAIARAHILYTLCSLLSLLFMKSVGIITYTDNVKQQSHIIHSCILVDISLYVSVHTPSAVVAPSFRSYGVNGLLCKAYSFRWVGSFCNIAVIVRITLDVAASVRVDEKGKCA